MPKQTQLPHTGLFWDKVDTEGECWLWLGATTPWGYGIYRRLGKNVIAHRYAYEQIYGPIPEGMLGCHSCDTPACVRPSHIFPGTPSDNTRDMLSKGRAATGERNGQSRLTESDVHRIRQVLADQALSHRAIGDLFGVHRATISLIAVGKNWAYLKTASPTNEATDEQSS